MRENGIENGIIFHNNTNGTCGFCNNMTGTFLLEGSKLTVVLPIDAKANNKRAIDYIKTYIGTDKVPKISKKYKEKMEGK